VQLSILYRGLLESCNYGCTYCPFAKKVDSRSDLAEDAVALDRFVDWVASRRQDQLGVLFTPWGEALIRPAYQQAVVRLSSLAHVRRVAAQTNLSCDLGWVDRANRETLALWCTYHPEWAKREAFVGKVLHLRALGVRVSVGMVAFRRFEEEIHAMRAALPDDVYLWLNAPKSSELLSGDEVARFAGVDPHFEWNVTAHPSRGRSCRTGASVVTVDERGDVRRCHFVEEVIGNLHDGSFDAALRERPCPNDTCGCHIGYVHLDELDLASLYADGLLERIPGRGLTDRSFVSASAVVTRARGVATARRS
jgi:organic radical activating enzyme